MRKYRPGLALMTGLIIAIGGELACSNAPESNKTSSAENKAKSGGVLGRLMESKKPFTIPENTNIEVTLDQALASNQAKSGDSFEATVSSPVVVSGQTVIPKGARAHGRVVEARESGRLKGVAEMSLSLVSVEVEGAAVEMETSTVTRTGGDHKKRNMAMIGGGAGAGALIGGIAGGGKGALIGGAVGAGAGTATAAATGKKDITIPVESKLIFRLKQAVTVQVRG